MALLLTSVFGVTGCGSDDDVQAESRVKNYNPDESLSPIYDDTNARVGVMPNYDPDESLSAIYDDDDYGRSSDDAAAAPEASGVSDAPSKVDCDRLLDLLDLNDLRDLLDNLDNLLDRLYLIDDVDRLQRRNLLERLDRRDRDDVDRLERRDLLDLLDYLRDRIDRFDPNDLRDLRELYDSCAEALKSGNYAPEGDDVDGG
jgi:hypothetical protein